MSVVWLIELHKKVKVHVNTNVQCGSRCKTFSITIIDVNLAFQFQLHSTSFSKDFDARNTEMVLHNSHQRTAALRTQISKKLWVNYFMQERQDKPIATNWDVMRRKLTSLGLKAKLLRLIMSTWPWSSLRGIGDIPRYIPPLHCLSQFSHQPRPPTCHCHIPLYRFADVAKTYPPLIRLWHRRGRVA